MDHDTSENAPSWDGQGNEQIAMLSWGIGRVWPMRRACSIATAVPSAFGRCEAMVEVIGMEAREVIRSDLEVAQRGCCAGRFRFQQRR